MEYFQLHTQEGIREEICTSRDSWGTYLWNPPQFLQSLEEFSGRDVNASDKPTFDEIYNAYEADVPKLRRSILQNELKKEVRRRITQTYGADSEDDEIWKRLRGEATTAQDTERDRLRMKYQALVLTVQGMTPEQLQLFDPTQQTLWDSE